MLAYFADATVPRLRVVPGLDLVLVGNTGVSFGLFNRGFTWGPWIFSLVALAIVAVLVQALRRASRLLPVTGMGLIIGGAIGNLVDRIRLGSVVDFIDVHRGDWHWYVFNAADAAICVGVALLLLDGLLTRPESPKA